MRPGISATDGRRLILEKGNTLFNESKYTESIDAFDEAIRIDLHYEGAWYNKGIVLYSQGKYDEAVQAFDNAIEIDPQLFRCLGATKALSFRSSRQVR